MGTVNVFYNLLRTEVTTSNITGHNTNEEYARLQYGGTTISSFGLVASQVVYSGSDKSRQGGYV